MDSPLSGMFDSPVKPGSPGGKPNKPHGKPSGKPNDKPSGKPEYDDHKPEHHHGKPDGKPDGKPEHHDGKPDGKPEHHGQKPEDHGKPGKPDCGGNCGGDFNSNYAPMNSNVQNFVNIETDINTNINMNMGGRGGYKEHKPNHHGMPDWEFDFEKEHEKDHRPETGKGMDWGWDVVDDNQHEDFDGDHMAGWPVWEGADISMRDIIQVIGGKLGLEKPEDIHDLLEKDEVKNILQGFLHSISKDDGFNHNHDHHHQAPVETTQAPKPDATTHKDNTDNTATDKMRPVSGGNNTN